jgi:hypothetical protein
VPRAAEDPGRQIEQSLQELEDGIPTSRNGRRRSQTIG